MPAHAAGGERWAPAGKLEVVYLGCPWSSDQPDRLARGVVCDGEVWRRLRSDGGITARAPRRRHYAVFQLNSHSGFVQWTRPFYCRWSACPPASGGRWRRDPVNSALSGLVRDVAPDSDQALDPSSVIIRSKLPWSSPHQQHHTRGGGPATRDLPSCDKIVTKAEFIGRAYTVGAPACRLAPLRCFPSRTKRAGVDRGGESIARRSRISAGSR